MQNVTDRRIDRSVNVSRQIPLSGEHVPDCGGGILTFVGVEFA